MAGVVRLNPWLWGLDKSWPWGPSCALQGRGRAVRLASLRWMPAALSCDNPGVSRQCPASPEAELPLGENHWSTPRDPLPETPTLVSVHEAGAPLPNAGAGQGGRGAEMLSSRAHRGQSQSRCQRVTAPPCWRPHPGKCFCTCDGSLGVSCGHREEAGQ